MNDARQLAIDYLLDGKLLHLGTVGEGGQTWVTHVWYAVNPSVPCLVFQSRPTRRHSLEIAVNPIVAGGVFHLPQEGLGQPVRGISFEGTARQVSASEISSHYEIYASKWPQVREMTPVEMFTSDSGPRLYRIDLRLVVLFDELNFPDEPRREVNFQ